MPYTQQSGEVMLNSEVAVVDTLRRHQVQHVTDWLGPELMASMATLVYEDTPGVTDAQMRALEASVAIEGHVPYFGQIFFGTDLIRNPKISDRVTVWSFEEFRHHVALAWATSLLKAKGQPADTDGIIRVRTTRSEDLAAVRETVATPLVNTMVGKAVSSISAPTLAGFAAMVGAANEWTAHEIYSQTSRDLREACPPMSQLTGIISREEVSHGADNLEEWKPLSELDRVVDRTVWYMNRKWTIVGEGLLSPAASLQLLDDVFTPEQQAALFTQGDAYLSKKLRHDGEYFTNMIGRVRAKAAKQAAKPR